jgi:D-alanyl-D-alanine endopeptidase (penicillin-binding protein 7)
VKSLNLKKNWLAMALVSVLSVALSAPSLAEAKAASTRDKTHAKTPASAAKASSRSKTRAVSAARPATSKVAGRARLHRAGVSRAALRSAAGDDAPPARVMPVSVNAASLARPTASASSLAAASGASGASFGQLYGLHQTPDPLELKSSVALVLDQDTNEVLFAKNSEAVLPIASLTKLMTGMVMVEARLPMEEMLTVSNDDVDNEKNSSSRLTVGATLSRGELLHLALMSSENRAAHALGRTFPGGLAAFVAAMNAKARALGMSDTHYVDPTGLNSQNQSSAHDLAMLVKAAYQQPLIRELSTSPEYAVRVGARQLQYHNTNSLVRNPSWDIGLQKTGYIVEAGRCLVLQARMAGRKLIMVFLDSAGKYSRQADAERVRRWVEKASSTPKGAVSVVPPGTKVTS